MSVLLIMTCPTSEELLDVAFGSPDASATSRVAGHIADCPSCQQRLHDVRALSTPWHFISAAASDGVCLTDEAIATLADGSNGNVDHFVLEHLAACAECRARAVAVTQLLNNADVMSAIQALEQPRRVTPRNWSRRQVAVTFAAAAAVAFVIAGPAGWLGNTETAHTDDPPHRDPTLTAAAAPRIVSPPTIAVGDSLRWTRVPESDLYRVRIWNSEGTVIWTVDTRDTSVAVPPSLTPGARFLWEVDARTGWERWVSSDLFAVTMRGARTR